MENMFLKELKNETNFTHTENGAVAHKTTNSAVYDMFSLGAAYRKRNDADCINLFINALEENESLALKCLFYLRDIRGGQGERRFFRVCYKWLANNNINAAKRNMEHLSEYGRWDDLIYSLEGTKLEQDMLQLVKTQLALDLESKTPSLLAKWVPSENASSHESNRLGNKIRAYMKMTHKQYRKMLSTLRERINIVERLMSANEWDKIEFDKIPSKAGLIYKNAFARRDIIAKKYETFIKSDTTKVNAKTLFPYEIVSKATNSFGYYGSDSDLKQLDRETLEKYWNNLPDYLDGKDCKMMCIVDTSASMRGSNAAAAINVAIALGMYCAERIGGAFKNHYISFSSKPQLIKIEGVDFVDKVQRIYKTNLCENTDLNAVFKMLKELVLRHPGAENDMPETLVVISDMEIDSATGHYSWSSSRNGWSQDTTATEMEKIRKEWDAAGLKMPKLVYWNVESRDENKFLDSGENVTFVGGASPIIFQQVLKGVTGIQLMLDKLMSTRYEIIK